MAHRRIEAPQFAHLKVAQATSDRFFRALQGQDALPEAVLLTKAEFTERFLTGGHETFSLDKLAQFRRMLLEADPATGEEEFRKACADLKPFVVVGDDKQVIKYVREKKKPSAEPLSKAGEGSKGGKVIGHTRSGKPIYDTGHENYTERRKFRGMNGEVATDRAVGQGSTHAKQHFASKHEGWTKEDHADAAVAHRKASKEMDRQWGEKQKEAHHHTFGSEPGIHDYKVSGIGREEYSEKHKDELRHLAHKGTAHSDAASAHERLAGGQKHYAKD